MAVANAPFFNPQKPCFICYAFLSLIFSFVLPASILPVAATGSTSCRQKPMLAIGYAYLFCSTCRKNARRCHCSGGVADVKTSGGVADVSVASYKVHITVIPSISIQEHAGNDKSCVWHATDFADGELKEELFCIRFPSVENNKRLLPVV